MDFMPPCRPSPKIFLTKELSNYLRELSSSSPDSPEKKMVDEMISVLKENTLAGEAIRKNQIPKHYIAKYGVNNLFRYHHPGGYRSCYTLVECNKNGVCPLILDFMSHREYDQRFGYNTT